MKLSLKGTLQVSARGGCVESAHRPKTNLILSGVFYVKVFLKGCYIMEEDYKEKEFYRGSIIGMLENIDNVEILAYVYVIVSDILSENKKGV